MESTLSYVPNDSSLENIPDVSSPVQSSSYALDTLADYHLPFKHNRGKPPIRYSLNLEGKGTKYSIIYHVTTRGLSEPLKAFVHKLCSCYVPCGVHEALAYLKWSQAPQKNKT